MVSDVRGHAFEQSSRPAHETEQSLREDVRMSSVSTTEVYWGKGSDRESCPSLKT